MADWVQVERDMGFEVPGSHVSCKTVMLIAESVDFECCRPPMVIWYSGTDLLQSRRGWAVAIHMMQISVLRLSTS